MDMAVDDPPPKCTPILLIPGRGHLGYTTFRLLEVNDACVHSIGVLGYEVWATTLSKSWYFTLGTRNERFGMRPECVCNGSA